MKTYQTIYNLVKKIPKGKVMTYGQIGQILDLNPRVVGWALNRLAKYRTEWESGGDGEWERRGVGKRGIGNMKRKKIPNPPIPPSPPPPIPSSLHPPQFHGNA